MSDKPPTSPPFIANVPVLRAGVSQDQEPQVVGHATLVENKITITLPDDSALKSFVALGNLKAFYISASIDGIIDTDAARKWWEENA